MSLDLKSPRTRVAISILGINPESQLSDRTPSDFSGSKEAREKAHIMYIDRREKIIDDINRFRMTQVTDKDIEELDLLEDHESVLPSKLGKSSVKHKEIPVVTVEDSKSDEIVKKEAARLQALKKVIKEDIKNMLTDEMRKQKMEKARQEQQAKFEAKLLEKAKEREERRKKLEADLLAKEQKRIEMQKKLDEEKQELKKELESKIIEKMTKVEQKKNEIIKLKAKEAEEFKVKTQIVRQKIETSFAQQQNDSLQKYKQLQEKVQSIAKNKEIINDIIHEKAAANSKKISSVISEKKALESKEEQNRETRYSQIDNHYQLVKKNYSEKCDALNTGLSERAKKREEHCKQMKETTKTKESEWRQSIEQNYNEREKRKNFAEEKKKELDQLSQHIQDKRLLHEIVVKDNRDQLERARSSEIDKRLLKQILAKEKMESLIEAKKKLEEQRVRTIEKSWRQKNKLLRNLEKIKSSANNEQNFMKLVEKMGVSLPKETEDDPKK